MVIRQKVRYGMRSANPLTFRRAMGRSELDGAVITGFDGKKQLADQNYEYASPLLDVLKKLEDQD